MKKFGIYLQIEIAKLRNYLLENKYLQTPGNGQRVLLNKQIRKRL